MSDQTEIGLGRIDLNAGLDDTDDGYRAKVYGDAFPRVHITPQGEVLTGDGTTAPVPLSSGAEASDADPDPLGEPSPGTSDEFSRGDHVHEMPTAAEVGAATEAYADGKVADAINDGTTGVAPSQNAVYDALALKAPLASPALTGSPTAPTQTAADNSTKLATTAYADAAVAVRVPKMTYPMVLSGASQLALPGMTWSGISNVLALTANRIHYVPFLVTESITVDRIGYDVTNAVASSNARVGVYAATTQWYPTGAALIDATQTTATTGAKVSTVSATLAPGRYVIAIVSDSAITVRSGQGSSTVGSSIDATNFGGGGHVIFPLYTYAALTYPGSLPNTGPSPTATGAPSSALPVTTPVLVLRWS